LKRVLLDEDLPHKLRPHLSEFDVWTVLRAGWAGVKNGMLLRLAEELFDVFVTGDKNIPYQQNLRRSTLGIVVLRTGGTRFPDIQPYLEQIRDAIAVVAPGELVFVPPEQ
jgi:hypothetical protein